MSDVLLIISLPHTHPRTPKRHSKRPDKPFPSSGWKDSILRPIPQFFVIPWCPPIRQCRKPIHTHMEAPHGLAGLVSWPVLAA
jgi:hypothetical protein